MNPRQLWLHDGSAAAIEKMLVDCRAAHRESCGHDRDLLLGLQLTHSGRFSFRRPLLATHDPILDPLTRNKSNGQFVDASYPLLTDDDLKRIEDQYVAAAKLAARIGCDFVDLKQCHRYLLSELLAAKNRPGEYGGSLENRTRLVRNIITRIRAELPSLLIASRFNAYDGIPYRGAGEDFIGEPCPHELPLATAFGTDPQDHLQDDLTEPLQLARWLREWGVCLLNVSLGNPYANPHLVRPAEYPPVDGYKPPEHPLIGVDRHFRIAARAERGAGRTGHRQWFQLAARLRAASRRRQCVARSSDVCWSRPRHTVATGFRPATGRHRPTRSQARLPHVLVLHEPDANQRSSARPIRHRLSAVRQRSLRPALERGGSEAGK